MTKLTLEKNRKGEFYSKISEIISEKDAWSMLLASDDFESELDGIVESRQEIIEKEARAELKENCDGDYHTVTKATRYDD